MEMSTRELWTVLHGMGFGALFLLAFTGAMVAMARTSGNGSPGVPGHGGQAMLRVFLIGMALLAWATVLSGTYIVYP